MKNRTFCLLFIVLNGLFSAVLMQQQQQHHGRRKTQSETRIKLPSDIAFTHESTGDIEGEACYNLLHRTDGICMLPNQCPEAIRDFQKGIQPQLCNYKGHLPIICCPRSRKTTVTTTVTVASSSPLPSSSSTSSQSFPTPTIVTTYIGVPISTTPTSSASSSVTESTRPSSHDVSNRISARKCKEYTKLMIEETVVTTLSLSNPENRTVHKSKCAKSSSEGFIVGGTKTEHGEFPHMAAIGWQQDEKSKINWNCGGSLISHRYVLTAAHCASWRGMKPKVVRMGDQNLKRTDDDSRARDYGIAQVIRHPDYKPSSKYNDIALLELDRDVPFSDYIKPACLWQTFDVNYSSGIATGWGLTRDRGNPSDELLKVQLNLITNDRCNEIYDRFQAIKDGIIDTQFCAGNEFEGKDTCNGDSGGPLQVATPDSACTYHLIGVTSFGMACGSSYGVYTRISQFLGWIESVAWNNYD